MTSNPLYLLFANWIFPPWELIISSTIARPKPTPDWFKILLLSSLKQGLKTFLYWSSGIPGPSSSKIINIQKGNNRALIIIEDDGPGIPEDQYKNVFKPFFRLDKSRSLNQAGDGLGLAIVEDIINSHGGNIQLGKSNYNGLQVRISLPF